MNQINIPAPSGSRLLDQPLRDDNLTLDQPVYVGALRATSRSRLSRIAWGGAAAMMMLARSSFAQERLNTVLLYTGFNGSLGVTDDYAVAIHSEKCVKESDSVSLFSSRGCKAVARQQQSTVRMTLFDDSILDTRMRLFDVGAISVTTREDTDDLAVYCRADRTNDIIDSGHQICPSPPNVNANDALELRTVDGDPIIVGYGGREVTVTDDVLNRCEANVCVDTIATLNDYRGSLDQFMSTVISPGKDIVFFNGNTLSRDDFCRMINSIYEAASQIINTHNATEAKNGWEYCNPQPSQDTSIREEAVVLVSFFPLIGCLIFLFLKCSDCCQDQAQSHSSEVGARENRGSGRSISNQSVRAVEMTRDTHQGDHRQRKLVRSLEKRFASADSIIDSLNGGTVVNIDQDFPISLEPIRGALRDRGQSGDSSEAQTYVLLKMGSDDPLPPPRYLIDTKKDVLDRIRGSHNPAGNIKYTDQGIRFKIDIQWYGVNDMFRPTEVLLDELCDAQSVRV